MIEYEYPSEGTYVGRWNGAGKRHGMGRLQDPKSGTVYFGEFEEGVPCGLGVLHMNDDCSYAGQFMNGEWHGLGVLKDTASGFRVEGTFQNGKIDGLGRITFPDGSRGIPYYEGLLQNHRILKQQKCPNVITNCSCIEEQALEIEEALSRKISTFLKNKDVPEISIEQLENQADIPEPPAIVIQNAKSISDEIRSKKHKSNS